MPAERKRSSLVRPRPTRPLIKRKKKRIIRMSEDSDILIPGLTGRYPQDGFRHGDYLHVSDLLYKCTRKIAISELLGEDIHAETIWPGRALTFEYGRATEGFLRDRLKKSKPRELYGHWECACGHTSLKNRTWARVKDVVCERCGLPPSAYKEIVVRDDEYMVTGSIDITLLMESYFYLNECKSMAKKSWDELKRPMPEHVLQILFYWWGMRRKGKRLWDQVSIIYVNKEFMFSGIPYKEFKFRPSIVIDRLDPLLEEARQLVEFRKNGQQTLPVRTMCDDCQSTAAQRCQFNSVCFQMEG